METERLYGSFEVPVENKRRLNLGYLENYSATMVGSLTDVLKTDIFNGNYCRSVVMDLDGVLCTNNSVGDYFRIKSLNEIISLSDEFTVYSARFNLREGGIFDKVLKSFLKKKGQAVINYPFFNSDSGKNLERFVKNSNPECECKIKVDCRKVVSTDSDIFSLADRVLSIPNGVFVYIGSGFVDKVRVENIAKKMNLLGRDVGRIHYLYTGKGLI
jgi:hypothetical protein